MAAMDCDPKNKYTLADKSLNKYMREKALFSLNITIPITKCRTNDRSGKFDKYHSSNHSGKNW